MTQRLKEHFKCDGNILYSDNGGTIQLYKITSFTLKMNSIVQLSYISIQMFEKATVQDGLESNANLC